MQRRSWIRTSIGRRQAIGAALAGGAASAFAASTVGSAAAAPIAADALGARGTPVLAAAPTGDAARDTRSILAAVNSARATGRPARLRPGTYVVDSLHLPSNTDLDLGGSTIQQVHPSAGSDRGAAVRNADFERGNNRISLSNGTITLGAGSRGRIVAMTNVRQLTLTGLTISKGSGDFSDWMLYVRQAQDVVISDCTVTGGTLLGEDGIHLEACRRVFINGCTVSAGDDALAIVQQAGCPTVTSDVFVSNCKLSSHSAYVVRCSVYRGEKHGIYDVHIADCSGRLPSGATGNAMIVNDDTGRGRVAHVDVSGLTITSGSTVAGGVLVRGVRNSAFARLRVEGVRGRSFDVRTCRTVTFQSCAATARAGAAGEGWWIQDSTDVGLVACVSVDSPVSSFTVSGAGSSRISFTGCRATHPGSYGFSLYTAANVRLIDCGTTKAKIAPLYDQLSGRVDRLIL